RTMVRKQERVDVGKLMGLRHSQTQFLHDGLEVLLGALLAVKTNPIMDGRLASAALPRENKVLLGLSYPFRACLFHSGLCPSTGSPSEMTPPQPSAISCCAACER